MFADVFRKYFRHHYLRWAINVFKEAIKRRFPLITQACIGTALLAYDMVWLLVHHYACNLLAQRFIAKTYCHAYRKKEMSLSFIIAIRWNYFLKVCQHWSNVWTLKQCIASIELWIVSLSLIEQIWISESIFIWFIIFSSIFRIHFLTNTN